MGILERTRQVVRASLNDLLGKADNPELVLEGYLEDLEALLAEAQGLRATEEAERHIFTARARDLTATKKTWEHKALLCLRRGDEELAKAALEHKLDLNDELTELTHELAQRDESLAILDEGLRNLQDRITEVGKKRRELRFRRQLLQARGELQEAIGKLAKDSDEPLLTQARERLAALESGLEAAETARVEELDARFLHLEGGERNRRRQEALDHEFEQLRKRVGKKS